MSLYDYQIAINLKNGQPVNDIPFYSIIMLAMIRADSNNIELLKVAFPEIYNELIIRYAAPGGVHPNDQTNGVVHV